MQFRTKARAVDLLGKGQIADLPTAITELWKNGYDAYADNLRADLYLDRDNSMNQSYFIISDDGKGMSSQDVLGKWLVLGTDSKSRAEVDVESEETLWKRPRIKAGEKGIGRLSIAYLGNPMLMLTKKIGYPLQSIFFDWRLLENYNLFLDDVNIPLFSHTDLSQFEQSFTDLKKEFLNNFEDQANSEYDEIWEGDQKRLKNTIINDVNNANLNVNILNDINSFFGTDDSHGTMFIVFNPIDQIIKLGEKDEDDIEDRSFVISNLIGFTNPFKESTINVNTSFLIHENDQTFDLLTSEGEFFEPGDFNLADVMIEGVFDGRGGFSGRIKIYDEIIDYDFQNSRRKDIRSFYGEIPIKLGYNLGEEKSSGLNEELYSKIKSKVDKYSGFYIYRDDFRVLPYGRSNYDFLGFEERRSKRAGTYFFSYRRMFGYLDITRSRNPLLKDKSSREGLINNSQFRAFTNDAIGFFVNLAQDYFSTKPKKSIFNDKKKEIALQSAALKADKERERLEKSKFSKALSEYPKKLENHQAIYEKLLEDLEEKLDNVNVTYSEIEIILDKLQNLDIEFKTLIPKIPKRYKPTETQLERLEKFETRLNNYQNKIVPRRRILDEKAKRKLEIRDLKLDITKRFNSYLSNLEKIIFENKNFLREKFDSIIKEYDFRGKNITKSFQALKDNIFGDISSKDQLSRINELLQESFNKAYLEIEETLIPLSNHISRLTFEIDEEAVQGFYKEDYEKMLYQWEQTRETAQLGIAVEIIDHEFNQLYAKINRQLKILGNIEIIDNNKEFEYLETNFKQLEDKYSLLSPLYRISGAIVKDVSCKAIFEYLNDFFESQLKDYQIKFFATNNFLESTIRIKEPLIYTVFINIINNAIYWMRNKDEKIIKLDYFTESEEIVIVNSGEKIPDFRIKKIFELFYSKRPNGRGVGLYLSQESLRDAGLELSATNEEEYNIYEGACFVIKKKN